MYKNGKKNGVSVVYYPGIGTKHYELTYKDGVLNGVAKEYYEDGSLKAEWEYKNGKL